MDLNDGSGGGGSDSGAGTVDDLLGSGAASGGNGSESGAKSAEGGSGGSEGGADPDWYGSLSAELGDGETASNVDYVKAKGFKDLDGLVKAYRSAEKGIHDSGRVKIPGEGASEAEIAEYRTAIGVPEKPEDYARPEPKGADGNPIPLNEAMTDRIFAAAHKIGLPKSAAEQLVAGEIEQQIAEHDAAQKQLETAANDHVKGWGDDKGAKLAQVNAALKEAGFSREDVAHMRAMPSGPGKFLDAFAKFGTNFSEDALVKGDRSSFGKSPEEAQKELDAMKADPSIADKIMVKGTAEHTRYNRLLDAVAGAADRKAVDN